MANAFSLASWNVEHFKDEPVRVQRVVELRWNGPAGGYPPANIDHVVSSNHLTFKQFDSADVDVRGWAELKTDAEKVAWIKKYSDHSLLYMEVQKI
jgi:hypothetical protein